MLALLMGNKNLLIGAILLALLAGTGIYIKILKSEVATAKAQALVLTGELEVSQSSVQGLQAAIINQNTAITKLKSDSDARELAHKSEIIEAEKKSNTFKQQAQTLMNKKIPVSVNSCDAADQLINGEIGK